MEKDVRDSQHRLFEYRVHDQIYMNILLNVSHDQVDLNIRNIA